VEQPRVLDGDNSLCGEALHKRNLLLGEWTNLGAIDDDRTNQRIILEHRYVNGRSRSAEIGSGTPNDFSGIIGGHAQLLCSHDAFKSATRYWYKWPALCLELNIFPWSCADLCTEIKVFSIKEVKVSEFCPANARCILQDRAENRLQSTRR